MCSVFHISLHVKQLVGFYAILYKGMYYLLSNACACASLDCNYPMHVCHHKKGGDCWLC